MNTAVKDEPIEKPGVSVGLTRFCLDVFFVLMLLLNGSAMLKSAEQLEFGRAQVFWVAVLRPLAYVSHVSGFDRVRSGAEKSVGNWLNRPVQKKKVTI